MPIAPTNRQSPQWQPTAEEAAELFACADSPWHFLSAYGRINDPLRGPIPFEQWPHFRPLLRAWQRNRLTITLKARQLGVSWLVAGFALHQALYRPGATVLLVSKRELDAAALLAKCRCIHGGIPRHLAPSIGANNATTLEFPALGSKISALPATASAGRSEGATLVVLDEYAFHDYAAENYAAIKPTIDAGGSLLIVSTANGFGNQFQRLWRDASDDAELMPRDGILMGRVRGSNGFRALFVPWHARPGRDAAWMAQQSTEYPPALLAQEYPQSPTEAFMVSGAPVFEAQHLAPDPEPSVVPRAELGAALQELPGLTVYRAPVKGRRYLIGADVAQGLGHGDASAVTVLERVTPNRYVEAAHLHGRMPPDVLAEYLDTLARHYLGIVAVERNNHGHATLFRLRQITAAGGAPYTVYHEVAPLRTPANGYQITRVGLPGWNTTSASKPLMIAELEAALRLGQLGLATPALLGELRQYQRLDNGDTAAPSGEYDDRVIALAIAWQMRKWQPPRVEVERSGPRPRHAPGAVRIDTGEWATVSPRH